jgi:hypothetical protein
VTKKSVLYIKGLFASEGLACLDPLAALSISGKCLDTQLIN